MPIISTYYNQLWLIDYSNHLPNFHEWFLENNIEFFFHNIYIRLIILYFPLFQIEKCHWLPKWPNVLKVCEFRLVFFSTWPTALFIADKCFEFYSKQCLSIEIVITKHTGVSELMKLSHLNIFFISSPLIHKQMYTR